MKYLKNTLKRFALIFLGVGFMFGGCSRNNNWENDKDISQGDGYENNWSNKNLSHETRNIEGDFDKVSVSGSFDVVIEYGDFDGKVHIEAKKKDLQHIEIKNKKGTLKISYKKSRIGWGGASGPMKIRLQAKDLHGLVMSGSGSIIANGTQKVNSFNLVLSGSGSIKAATDSEEVDQVISGSGEVELKGRTGKNNIVLSGSGDVESFGLNADYANITVSGSGDVEVHASDNLNVMISGSGDVVYKGNPNVKSNIIGSGDVEKH